MATANKFFKTTITLGILVLGLSYHAASFADRDTKNLLGGYGGSDAALNQLAAHPNDGSLIVPQDNAQGLYLPAPTNPYGTQKTLSEMLKFFQPTTQQAPDKVLNNNTLTFGPPGTQTGNDKNYFQPTTTQDQEEQKQTTPFANVDLNTLLGPLVYKDADKKAASNFINAIANLSNPFSVVDLPALAASKNPPVDPAVMASGDPNVMKYLTELRSYAAMQAVGVSNLYQFYAERSPSQVDPEKDKDLYNALQALKMPNASPLQVQHFMATRRLTDPSWVANLSNDTPAALLRQIAILLSENLAEAYNNRMATERLTATMSVVVLQQAANMRIMLEQDAKNLTDNQQPANSGPNQ